MRHADPHNAAERADRLARLLENGRADQWSLDADLDWRQEPKLPWWLPARRYAILVAQVWHGERATLALCAALRPHLADAEAQAFIDLQEIDERRHVAAYERYLARLGEVAGPDEATTATLEGGLAWRGHPLGLMVAFHIVLEGEALTIQHDLAAHSRCPLFRALNARAARDEARHVAFGKAYLRDRLGALSAEERLDIYRWVKALWRDCAHAIRARYTGASRAFFALSRGSMSARWARHHRALAELGLLDGIDAGER